MRRSFITLVLVAAVLVPGPAHAEPFAVRIDDVTPNTFVAGAPDTEITITGDGFRDRRAEPVRERTRVVVDGAYLETTVVDRRHLRAIVPGYLLSRPDTLDLFVYDTVGRGRLAIPVSGAGPVPLTVFEARPSRIVVDVPNEADPSACTLLRIGVVDEHGRSADLRGYRFALSADDLDTPEPSDGDLQFFRETWCADPPVTSVDAENSYQALHLSMRGARPGSFAIEATVDGYGVSGLSTPHAIRGGWVTGRVTGPGGAPLEGVGVRLVPIGSAPFGASAGLVRAFRVSNCDRLDLARPVIAAAHGTGEPVVVTRADGTYRTRPLRPDRYLVQFLAPHGTASVWSGGTDDPAAASAVDVVDRSDALVDAALVEGGSVTGRVTNASGQAVVRTPAGTVVATAPIAADGRYTVTGLRPGGYDVDVEPDDPDLLVTRVASSVAVAASATADAGEATLPPGASFDGTFPEAGGYVTVYSASGEPVAEGWLDNQRAFRTRPGLPAGHYRVRATPWIGYPAWLGGSSFATADVLHLDAAERRTIDVPVAPSGSIAGQLTAGTRVVPGLRTTAPLVATRVDVFEPDGTWVTCGYTGDDGMYSIDVPAGAAYQVRFSRGAAELAPEWFPDAAGREEAAHISVAAGQTRRLDATLERGARITGSVSGAASHVVVYKDGEPIAGWLFKDPWSSSSYVDEDGTYTIAGLAAGRYRVEARGSVVDPTYGWLASTSMWYPDAVSSASATPVEVHERATVTGIDVALATPGRVTGTIDGLTRRNAYGSIVLEEPSTRAQVGWATAIGNGAWSSSLVPPGRYLVRFAGTADRVASDAPEVVVGSGATTGNVSVHAVPGTAILGRVTSSTGDGVSFASVRVHDASGRIVGWTSTRADGSYGTPVLPAGTYRLRFDAPDVFARQWYAGRSSLETADPVVLGGTADATGTDVTLSFA